MLSSFWLLLDVINGYSKMQGTFGVGSFEDRFRPLKSVLPAHGVVGYASDNPQNSQAGLAEFYLAQYTLAPTIVSSSVASKGSLVVVNFHSTAPDLRTLQSLHLRLVQNFGAGVLLCRKDE